MARGKGLYRRGRIWWLMYAGLDGKVRFESSKTSDYREAEAKLIDRRKGIQEGKEPSTVKIRNHTFADLAAQYLLWATRQRAYRRKQIIVKQLVSEFGNLPLRRFSTALVEEYQSKMLAEGKAPATANRHIACLKHAFTKAVEWEMVEEDTLKRVRRAKLFEENNRRLRYLSKEECKALAMACSDHLKPIVSTALNTGMRKEEILSLEWEKHIDLRHGFILLDRTKNGERREIPINGTLREVLQGIVRRVGVPYVFCDKERTKDKDTKEEKWTRYKDIKKGFHAACRRAGIKDFRFHDLRPYLRVSTRHGGRGYHHGQGALGAQDAYHDPAILPPRPVPHEERPLHPRCGPYRRPT